MSHNPDSFTQSNLNFVSVSCFAFVWFLSFLFHFLSSNVLIFFPFISHEISQTFESERKSQLEFVAAQHAQAVKDAEQRHSQALSEKQRLGRMAKHVSLFHEQIMKRREEDYRQKLVVWQAEQAEKRAAEEAERQRREAEQRKKVRVVFCFCFDLVFAESGFLTQSID